MIIDAWIWLLMYEYDNTWMNMIDYDLIMNILKINEKDRDN